MDAHIRKLNLAYPYIVAWGLRLGSDREYITMEQERALEAGAPADAVYEKFNATGRTGQWETRSSLDGSSIQVDYLDARAAEIRAAAAGEPGSVAWCESMVMSLFLATGESLGTALVHERAAGRGVAMSPTQIDRVLVILNRAGKLHMSTTPRTRERVWSNAPAALASMPGAGKGAA